MWIVNREKYILVNNIDMHSVIKLGPARPVGPVTQ